MNMRIVNKKLLPDIIDHMPEIVACGKNWISPEVSPSFRLNNWSFLIFNYYGKIQLGEEIFEHTPGCAFFTSPGVFKHHFPKTESFHFYVHMNFPATNSKTYNKDYWFFDLEQEYSDFLRELGILLIYQQRDMLRSRVCLWNILQKLKDSRDSGIRHEPAVLTKAIEYIESNLHNPALGVLEISQVCGVSPSYLLRVFRRYRDVTIVGYLRRRRLELAHSLLVNSDQQVKDIAKAVGIPDLHYFNKCIKARYKHAPRFLRG